MSALIYIQTTDNSSIRPVAKLVQNGGEGAVKNSIGKQRPSKPNNSNREGPKASTNNTSIAR